MVLHYKPYHYYYHVKFPGTQVAGGYNPGFCRLSWQPSGFCQRCIRGLLRPDIRAVRRGFSEKRDARHLQFGRQSDGIAVRRFGQSDNGR